MGYTCKATPGAPRAAHAIAEVFLNVHGAKKAPR